MKLLRLSNGVLSEAIFVSEVEHTKKPILSQFDLLIEQGAVTLDHLIKRTQTGSAREKGPIFKIKPNKLNLLFPPSEIHSLLS